MERRGSGVKKKKNAYKQHEHLVKCHVPDFTSNASEFYVTLWNLNYGKQFLKEFANEQKEFLKTQRMIYKMISSNPEVTIVEMSENMGLSHRHIRKYIKRITDLNFIVREGGRKNGIWKIIDEHYENSLTESK